MLMQCKHCGGEFEAPDRRTKICSDGCRRQRKNRYEQEYRSRPERRAYLRELYRGQSGNARFREVQLAAAHRWRKNNRLTIKVAHAYHVSIPRAREMIETNSFPT
jgi:hypothetical protein